MQETIKVFNTLQYLYTAMGIAIDQDEEFTIHSMDGLHGEVPTKSPIFRANYYYFLFVKTGKGKYIIDHNSYDIFGRTIYFTNPGHLKGFEIYEGYTGYIITSSGVFLKKYINENVFIDFPFLLAEIIPPNYVSNDKFNEFEDVCDQIVKEYNGNSSYKYKIIANLFLALLYKLKENFWDNYDPISEGEKSSQIVIDFKKNLENHFRDLSNSKITRSMQVQDFAELQFLHPNYLSAVIKTKTGKSINKWISDKKIEKAQALLSRSNLTVKEIAYRLAFNEPSHFTKFFKKHTGITPKEFQKSN